MHGYNRELWVYSNAMSLYIVPDECYNILIDIQTEGYMPGQLSSW